MEGVVNRYHKLGLKESLSRSCNYPLACRELALILKLSYSKFPKLLQSIVFQDVLTAFRLLPRMQTQSASSAANALLQSVESALPKQKKTLAVTEFKHAVVAHKRCIKAQAKEDLVELPQDVLVHIFSLLDLQSLVSASQVSRSWNVASSDNHISQLINKRYGGCGLTGDEKSQRSQERIDWRTNFKAYNSLLLRTLLTSSRVLCTHCHAIVWVTDMGNETTCRDHPIKPISTSQIVEYIDGDYASSDSDSDSDSYDDFSSKLWARTKNRF